MKNNKFKINIKNLIEYFDIKDNSEPGDINAIIAVLGEDLGAAVFQHYQEGNGRVVVVERAPKTGKLKGPRLDRWIKVGNKWYQAEIKNWSSRAVGGLEIPISTSGKEIISFAARNWERIVGDIESKKLNGVNKVLVRMNNSPREGSVIPLLIFWETLNAYGQDNFFFKFGVKKFFDFEYVWVFSVSLYLRSLLRKKKEIHLEMPNAARRIGQLKKVFKTPSK